MTETISTETQEIGSLSSKIEALSQGIRPLEASDELKTQITVLMKESGFNMEISEKGKESMINGSRMRTKVIDENGEKQVMIFDRTKAVEGQKEGEWVALTPGQDQNLEQMLYITDEGKYDCALGMVEILGKEGFRDFVVHCHNLATEAGGKKIGKTDGSEGRGIAGGIANLVSLVFINDKNRQTEVVSLLNSRVETKVALLGMGLPGEGESKLQRPFAGGRSKKDLSYIASVPQNTLTKAWKYLVRE